MKNKYKLESQIFNTLEDLGRAFNLGNKQLYKQCLCSLELDLAAYTSECKEIHQTENKLGYLYSKLWELR